MMVKLKKMKSYLSNFKEQVVKSYTSENENFESKSTNINVLLNRVKIDQKKESRKKILFTAVTSLGVLLFGVLIF